MYGGVQREKSTKSNIIGLKTTERFILQETVLRRYFLQKAPTLNDSYLSIELKKHLLPFVKVRPHVKRRGSWLHGNQA